jgi:hypothetical protein
MTSKVNNQQKKNKKTHIRVELQSLGRQAPKPQALDSELLVVRCHRLQSV